MNNENDLEDVKLLTEERLEELKNTQVSAMDVIMALSVARFDSTELMRVATDGFGQTEEAGTLYTVALAKLQQMGESPEVLEKTAVANMVQAIFLSSLSSVLGTSKEELVAIADVISGIKMNEERKERILNTPEGSQH